MIIETILDTTATSVTAGTIVSTGSRPVGKGIVTVEVSGTGGNAPDVDITGKLVYPVVDPVRNLLPYSTDPWDSPGLNTYEGDVYGYYWTAASKFYTANFSSIEMPGGDTNPFGGTSCIELSAMDNLGVNDWSRFWSRPDEEFIDYDPPQPLPSKRSWKEDYWNVFSMYVKRPPSLETSSFMMYNYDSDEEIELNRGCFEFVGGGTVLTEKAAYTTVGTAVTIDSVGNDWYRCTVATSGLGKNPSDTLEGDDLTNYIFQGDPGGGTPITSLTRMWIYGLQLEQKPIGSFNASAATFYQEVAGAKRVPEDDTVIGWPVIQSFTNIAANTTEGSEIDIFPSMSCTVGDNTGNRRIVVKIAYPDALAKK